MTTAEARAAAAPTRAAETSVARRVAIAATFTAEPLEESLAFWLERLGLPFEVQFAPFNQVFQELLDRTSLLSGNERGLNVLAVRLEDLGSFDSPAAADGLRARLDELAASAKASRAATASPLWVCVCPPSAARTRGEESEREYRRLEEHFVAALAGPGVARVLRHQDVLRSYPATIEDAPGIEAHGQIPYARAFYAALGTALARALHAAERPPAKVLVLDCDHTLWKGVSAEDGVSGVVVDAPRRAIQEFALRQRAAGVLICLCSKNVEEDVYAVLDGHPDMLLRREHVTASRINWESKSANLRALARELNLGLDSFVFLDDSAVECAEVRARAPEVLTLALPEDASRIASFLDHVWAFEGAAGTREDAKRAEFYRQEAERGALRQSATSFGDFIAGLGLEVKLFAPAPAQVARVAQLTQRTNQFNNTTIRRKEHEVRQLVASPDARCIAVEVRDRFGDYGLVGAVICSAGEDSLVADSLIMSCRALGRGVEHRLIADLGERAAARKLRTVEIPYAPTPKNQPVLRFLQSLRAEVEDRPDGAKVFRLEAGRAAQLVFTPDENAERVVDAEEADATPSGARPAATPRRIASERWQEIAQELSSIGGLLQVIDGRRRRSRPGVQAGFAAPRSEAEHTLARAWADALGLDRVGLHDDFFELGGTSLQATLLTNTLQQALRRRLDAGVIFEAPTVALMAERLGAMREAGPDLVPVRRQGSRGDSAPASFSQRRLWFLDQFDPGHPVYNERRAIRLRGPLDPGALERALAGLYARHESLRTTFATADGQPVQVVGKADFPGLEIHDLRTLPRERIESEADRYLGEQAARSFDLSRGPLFRAGLLRLGEDDHLLWLVFHHIVADGTSMRTMLRDLSVLYRAAVAGAPPSLPKLPVQYADFSVWQRDWLAGPSLDAQRGYWLQRFSGSLPVLELPLDRPRPPVLTYRGARVPFAVPPSVTAALAELSQREGATLFMGLMAAFQAMLHRYTGQDDLAVGFPIANRPRGELEDVVGFFVNTLVLRVDLSGEPTFLELLRRVRERALEAYAHQDMPFELLVDAVAPERHLDRTPLFQAMLALLDDPMERLELPGLSARWADVPVSTSRFDLLLNLEHGAEGLVGGLEYNSDIFDRETVSRMAGQLSVLLEGIVADPGRKLHQLPLMTEAERRQLLVDWRGGSAELSADDRCLHERFEARVERSPEAVAARCEGASLTYRELNERANHVANFLRERGVGPDVLVGLAMERSLDLVVGLLGILKAGGAYVPLDPTYPADRLSFLIEDAGIELLVTQESCLKALPAVRSETVCLDRDWPRIGAASKANPAPGAKAENLAYVIYTSGSTGKPKGVLITHRNVARLLDATDAWYRFDERDVWTLFHSYAFDFSVWELWGALLYGGSVVVVPYWVSRSPEAFRDLLVEERVTVLNQTPSAFRQLVRADLAQPAAPYRLRYVIFGGEALELQSLRPWFERYGDEAPLLVNMYGITETTVHVSYRPIRLRDLEQGAGSVIGIPIPDLRIYVLDAHGAPVPIGVPGEMYVGGAGVARGYLNRPELTAQRFVHDALDPDASSPLYRSGDLARWKSDGDLEYLGRIDHQVKIRGFRIELGEIEAALGEHPSVRDSVVIAREEGPGDRRLVAYVASDADAAALTDELRSRLKARLPEYMVPAAFVCLPVLPLTAHGKVDRKALPEPEFSRARRGAVVEPRTDAEKTLAAIWGSVLGVDRIGVDDNFFELGGDSILSIQVITRARDAGLAITPKQLFQNPTVAALAVLAAGRQAKTHAEQETLTGPVPLGPIQRWFLAQDFPEPHHWNQAFVFEATRRLDRAHVEGAVRALAGHHDALRLRCTRTAGEWRQEYAPESAAAPVVHLDFAKVDDAELAGAIEQALGGLQAGLSLERGQLMHVAYLECGPGRSARLAFIVHHLAVDGVSWRILLEDFERAYLQLERGERASLGPKTTSYRRWAERMLEFAGSSAVESEREYWMSVPAAPVAPLPLDFPQGGPNSEASSDTVAVRLGPEQTRGLLQQVPRAYGTQINDALLAALAGACTAWTAGDRILVDLEGHGREDIGEEVDLSRTVGWFTTLFPVELALPREGSLADSIRTVKETLRGVPRKGLGYGALRHLRADPGLAGRSRAEVVFNYLGQFDQVVAGSTLLRFAREASGPWHGPSGTRTHLIEVLALVVDGELEIRWIYSRNLHRRGTIEQLAAAYVRRLADIVDHCASLKARSYTPSDFPLARVDQATLDTLVRGRGEIEDVYPLSPMQLLFYSMDVSDSRLGSEQWHFLLEGPLDALALRRAWQRVVLRHPILRTAFVSEGLAVPLQIVHREAVLPWAEQDWRDATPAEQEARLQAFLHADRELAFDLGAAPLSRVTLLRVADESWHMVWSTHHLHVDGWSWPLIFGDLGRFYEAERAGSAVPAGPTCGYRRYIEWLEGRTSSQSEPFWRRLLRGVTSPTPLELARDPGGGPTGGDMFAVETAQLSGEDTARLQAFCRAQQLTLNTLVQAAWAMVLGHVSGRDDVVLGAAFSGRPAEVPGIESMVGPCVNNVPIRIGLQGGESFPEWLSAVQRTQFEVSEHQYVPLHTIQDWSEVPPRYRLFDSLLVFQNYVADEATRRLGPTLSIRPLSSPDATNYPLTLVVNPGAELRLKLIHHRHRFDRSAIASLLRELCVLLAHCAQGAGGRLADVMGALSPQTKGIAAPRQRVARAARAETGAPASEMEGKVAAVWKDLFQVDSVSFDDNFFDLGGHSLLLIRAHQRLRESVRPDLSIVAMLQYPTVRTLARHLSGGEKDSTAHDAIRERARKQRGAFAQRRNPAPK